MKNDIKISVAIVTYNCASCVKQSLDSIARQTYKNKEIIVVDGNSSDNTFSVVNEYAYIPHVFISEKDKGVYDAMNKALKLASGDFLIFLGADDLLAHPDVLSEFSSYVEDLDTVYYGNVYRRGRNDMYCGEFNSYKLAVKNISHQALFYPRSTYKKYSYSMDFKIFADYAYNIILWKHVKFKYLPFLVSVYQQGGLSDIVQDLPFESSKRRLVIKNMGILPYYYSKLYRFAKFIVTKLK